MNVSVATNASASPSTSIVPYLQSLLKSFNLYASIALLFPGLLLNTLTLAVFLRAKFWKKTTMGFFFYSVSSAFSLCAVVVGVLNFFPAVFNNDLHSTP
jgi:hypothetical protein